jgi:hypothetical protein
VSISVDVQPCQYCRSVCQPTLAVPSATPEGFHSSWSCQSRMPSAPLSRAATAARIGSRTRAESSPTIRDV